MIPWVCQKSNTHMKKIKPKYNPVSTLNSKRKECPALPARHYPLSYLPLEARAGSWWHQPCVLCVSDTHLPWSCRRRRAAWTRGQWAWACRLPRARSTPAGPWSPGDQPAQQTGTLAFALVHAASVPHTKWGHRAVFPLKQGLEYIKLPAALAAPGCSSIISRRTELLWKPSKHKLSQQAVFIEQPPCWSLVSSCSTCRNIFCQLMPSPG